MPCFGTTHIIEMVHAGNARIQDETDSNRTESLGTKGGLKLVGGHAARKGIVSILPPDTKNDKTQSGMNIFSVCKSVA